MRRETHFDRIAAAYNSSLPSHVVAHYLDRRAAVLRALVPPPGPALDVGCGTGLLAWKLEQIGYRLAVRQRFPGDAYARRRDCLHPLAAVSW